MAKGGPLGTEPSGTFNFEPPPAGRALYLEPTPKRIRVQLGGETIVDSRRAFFLHEGGHMPVYYLPAEDVRAEFLEATDHSTHCPKKGDATFWTVRAGGEEAVNGAWSYPDPIPGCPPLAGLVAFAFDAMGAWLEEDEPIRHHPRDPYHRVDVIATGRHIRVSLDGELLAETDRALALFETTLPPRWYIPREDVRVELVPSPTTTHCPYKGDARYASVAGAGEAGTDLVWFYEDPFDEVARVRGLVCFYDEKVDVELDGEAQPRPRTVFSDRLPGEMPSPTAGPLGG